MITTDISLLSIAGKILAKILLNRLNVHFDHTVRIQKGNVKDRDNRHDLHSKEKYQKQNIDLYMAFVDLTKAFDTVSRDGLWKIMAKLNCPPKFLAIAMVRQLHGSIQTRVH